jgi:hypothetical protein
MSYEPAPGSTAYRAIAHLQSLPPGAELMTSALAEAIGSEGKNIVPPLEVALASGLIFKRQRDTHVRSPMWWSLTDHGARPKVDIRQPAVPVASAKDSTAGDAQPFRGDEAAHVAQQESPGPVAASTPMNGRPPARNGHDEPEGAAAIAGGPATAKETAQRGATSIEPHSVAKGAGDDAKPAVGAAAPDGFRCALWSNGALQLERGAATLAVLTADETRALVAYLERLAE